jgi:[protein-PII] uridylyltransferase
MSLDAKSLKAFLSQRRKEIADAHASGANGFDTCCALSAMTDEALSGAFSSVSPEIQPHIAVFALGGYGRCELFPFSDVDVMVLCDAAGDREEANAAAKSFLHLLWDCGMNVGHSVRTLEDALALRGKSLDAWTAMVESRFLFGSAALAQAFQERMSDACHREPDLWFISGILADLENRDERYGNSVKLLEPNIKKSSGGLRDVHAVFWLHRGTEAAYAGALAAGTPATRVFVDTLLQYGRLDRELHAKAVRALEFLFRVRHEMHFERDSQHDSLEYALQRTLAQRLGYESEAELRSVEVFMRDYYSHARVVHSLNLQLSRPFRELAQPARGDRAVQQKTRGFFYIENGMLSVDSALVQFADPVQVFEAFALAAAQGLELDFRLRGAIERSASLCRVDHPRWSELAALFRTIIHSDRVAATLRDMNDLGVLGECIPEFGQLIAFFQHNVYHYYTADEHTLIALARAEQLRESAGTLHDVFRALRRKEILYLTILLHDIAKPLGVADHEVTGVEIARTVLRRFGLEEVLPDVAFLIRNHLVMEQMAFRRNIHDPATIREFSSRFERPEWLDYLYLLTYADLSAVNINVWTEWKAAMLQELYAQTAEVLRRELHGGQIEEFQQARRDAVIEQVVKVLSKEIPREEVERHLRAIENDAYVSVFTGEEIGEHVLAARKSPVVSTLLSQSGTHSEITVIAPDAPFALSKFCAVLSANDANIFDANVFTRDDGVIIDRFRVVDAPTGRPLSQRVCAKIQEDLAKVAQGVLEIKDLFQEHHRKWKRRPKKAVNPSVRTDVTYEETPRHTIIDVYAPDSVGLLYRITETISGLGLDIYFAKIATRVDGIVDSFYVLDRSGAPVSDRTRREAVKAKILETIRDMSKVELK